MGSKRVTGFALVIGIVAAVLAGCSMGGEPGASSSDRAMSTQEGAGAPVQPEARDEQAGREPVAGVRLDVRDRKLARRASLDLRASDVAAAAARVRAIAERAGGYSGEESIESDTARLSISVPGEKLDDVLGELAKVGEVLHREVMVEDVTERVADVDSRVASQRASVARVRALLARAKTIGEIVSIESELTSRESELEALLSRQKALRGTVEMSTVRMSIVEEDKPGPVDDSAGFLGGLSSGWHAFLVVLSALLTAIGAVLPFVVAFGVPAGLLVWQLRRRARARRAPAAAPAGPNAPMG